MVLKKAAIKSTALGLVLAGALAHGAAVQAQETLLVAPTLPNDLDKGRNQSVTERPRPDYDPLGIRLGSFILLPKLESSVGVTSNAFLTETDRKEAVFLSEEASAQIRSDWSRHAVQAYAKVRGRRYLGESLRNETAFDIGTLGRLDYGTDYVFTGQAQFARLYESPLSGEVDSSSSVLSNYDRFLLSAKAERRSGRLRLVGTLDRTSFAFSNIDFGNGVVRDQGDRDRVITRFTGQAEYARTPSFSFYGQLSGDKTDYSTNLTSAGLDNLDSKAVRVLGGANFDFAGRARGSIGAGYVWRRYDSSLYKDVSGFSVEGKFEYFPSELTTFTLTARRLIADANIGSNVAFFDNRASLRVDHELLRNLILTASGDIAYQDYVGTSRSSTVHRLSAGGRYMINHGYGLQATASYSDRSRSDPGAGNSFKEFALLFSFIIQR